MAYATVTLTSASTNTSTPVALNWIGGKPTIASVLVTSVSSGAFSLQYTLSDLQRTSSANVVWQGCSSGLGTTFPSNTLIVGSIFNCSNAYPDGMAFTFLAPIAGLRLSSTATNNVNNGTISLRVIQGEGW
jgi:hypothetical protein